MDDESEFPVPNRREREAIRRYLEIEQEFIAARNFYDICSNIQYRRHGIAVIARVWGRKADDAYIPYLALNFFDRFVTRNALPEWRNCTLIEQVSLVAICCVTISYKMRTKRFMLQKFLSDQQLSYKTDEILREEFRILGGLDWRMRSITPFYFLDYYYPDFKIIGGFKRRCINEVIVQCLGVDYFTLFTPSQIARAAFLAATYVAYPSKLKLIEQSEELSNCWRELVNLCHKMEIDIHTESGTVFEARDIVPIYPNKSEAGQVASQLRKHTKVNTDLWNTASEAKRQGQDRGKAVKVADDSSEEEDNVAPLTRRPRQDRGPKVVEADAKVAATEEKDVESENRLKEDKGKGVLKASEEIVEAETEVNPQKQDKGKWVVKACEEIVEVETEVKPRVVVVQEIVEEDIQVEIEYNRIRQLRGKEKVDVEEEDEAGEARFMSQIIPAAQEAPKKLMNFKLKWPILVQHGDPIQNLDENLIKDGVQYPQTIRGSGQNRPLYTRWCNNCRNFWYNNCCIIM